MPVTLFVRISARTRLVDSRFLRRASFTRRMHDAEAHVNAVAHRDYSIEGKGVEIPVC